VDALNRPNPFDEGFYDETQLRQFGFKQVGDDVRIARNCTIIGLHNISIGNHVRIDSNVVIAAASGELVIGSHIHIAAGCYLSSVGGLVLHDFAGLSQGVKIYTATDDYSGETLTNPTVPKQFKNVQIAKVVLGKHVIVGAGAVILPGCEIGEGSSIGALSLVTKSLEPWGVYFGTPAKRLKARSQKLLELEQQLRQSK
jgi:acetyltransferase-like isoleucine patch superfamily enzyme